MCYSYEGRTAFVHCRQCFVMITSFMVRPSQCILIRGGGCTSYGVIVIPVISIARIHFVV